MLDAVSRPRTVVRYSSPAGYSRSSPSLVPGTTAQRSTPLAVATHILMIPPDEASRLTASSNAVCTCRTHSSLIVRSTGNGSTDRRFSGHG